MNDAREPLPDAAAGEQYKRMPGDSLGGAPEHIAEVGVAGDGPSDWGIGGIGIDGDADAD